MDKVVFENVEKYVTEQLAKHNTSLEYKGYTVEPKTELVSVSKTICFETRAGTVLSLCVMEEGYLTIFFTSTKAEEKTFFFDMYLEKFDQHAFREYWDAGMAARESKDFLRILTSKLSYFLNYLDKSADLRAVLNGEKWFNIPFNFGGMR